MTDPDNTTELFDQAADAHTRYAKARATADKLRESYLAAMYELLEPRPDLLTPFATAIGERNRQTVWRQKTAYRTRPGVE